MGDRPLDESRAFFAARAPTWDSRFPGDGPGYARVTADARDSFDAHLRHLPPDQPSRTRGVARSGSDDHLLAAHNLEQLVELHGWSLSSVDDSEERYLAIARRA